MTHMVDDFIRGVKCGTYELASPSNPNGRPNSFGYFWVAGKVNEMAFSPKPQSV